MLVSPTTPEIVAARQIVPELMTAVSSRLIALTPPVIRPELVTLARLAAAMASPPALARIEPELMQGDVVAEAIPVTADRTGLR